MRMVNVKSARRNGRFSRGAAMIIALMLVLVLTILMAGTVMVAQVQLSASKSERDYERALMMAEAGVNAYVNMLENGAGTGTNAAYIPPAHTFTTSSPAPTLAAFKLGVKSGTYTVIHYPAGSQQGYFVGQTAGTGGTLTISGYGWSNGIVRRASVTATPVSGGTTSGYAIFGATKENFNGSSSITGSIGSNGAISMNGSNSISGNVVLDGSGASYTQNGSNSNGGIINNSAAVTFPTVETIANTDFPSGGLTYLAAHNDNSLCSTISGTTLSYNGSGTITFNSKAGGANYYLTTLSINGSANIYFNNTLGPITIWFGPSGSTSNISLNGSSSAVTMSANPADACILYSASSGSISLNGSSSLNMGLYNINNSGAGSVNSNGSGVVNSSIITSDYFANGSATVDYVGGYFTTPGSGTAYTSSNWTELE
jgi:Tfp pilus assembly protein PilX